MPGLSKHGLCMGSAVHKADARPWEVYEVEVREHELYGKPFKYLVERGAPAVLTVEGLDEAELFNRTLQRVDVTDDTSVLGFVNRYGMPVSPVYQGKMRLEWFRRRDNPGIRAFSPVPTDDLDLSMLMVNPEPYHSAGLDRPDSLLAEVDDDLKGNMPYILSERARELENGDQGTAGAVSLAEVKQTIRALQMATVLPMAFSYFAGNQGTAGDVIEYLKDPHYVSQGGAWYFLHGRGEVLGGGRLDDFKGSLASNSRFKGLVEDAGAQGVGRAAVDEGFEDALARELTIASWDALRWLRETYSSCRGTRVFWDHYMLPGESGFAAVARWDDQRGLPDFCEYGSLTEAIALQCLIVFSDEKPFRRCENCGRIFKKYREEGFKKNIRETRFCRRSCNVSFNQKNKKNRSLEGEETRVGAPEPRARASRARKVISCADEEAFEAAVAALRAAGIDIEDH